MDTRIATDSILQIQTPICNRSASLHLGEKPRSTLKFTHLGGRDDAEDVSEEEERGSRLTVKNYAPPILMASSIIGRSDREGETTALTEDPSLSPPSLLFGFFFLLTR